MALAAAASTEAVSSEVLAWMLLSSAAACACTSLLTSFAAPRSCAAVAYAAAEAVVHIQTHRNKEVLGSLTVS